MNVRNLLESLHQFALIARKLRLNPKLSAKRYRSRPAPARLVSMIWREFLDYYSEGDHRLFDDAFVERRGPLPWLPNEDDKNAAARLHTQIISRITTQPLGYLDGDEKTALTSVYLLFEETRKLCDQHPEGRHFEVLAWHVLNTYVRPFTAKWHRQSERGMLSALDTTDEFRAELEELQRRLVRFEIMLAALRDGALRPATPVPEDLPGDRDDSIAKEMDDAVSWGIPAVLGGIDQQFAANINAAEKEAIEKRRARYHEFYDADNPKSHAAALALSGGGIRSATFSLGVLVALARRGLLPQFDYLSTVSGGGYLGSFLTAYLNTDPESSGSPPKPAIGLRAEELPFQREGGEAEALRHIRHHSKYLASGSLADRCRMIAAQLYGMLLNGLGVVFLAALFALVEFYVRKWQVVEIGWAKIAAIFGSIAPAWMAVLWKTPIYFLGSLFVLWAIISLVLIRRGKTRQKVADTGLVIFGGAILAYCAWQGLALAHALIEKPPQWGFVSNLSKEQLLAILGAIPVIASALAGFAGKILGRVLGLLTVFAAPLFFFGVYLFLSGTPVESGCRCSRSSGRSFIFSFSISTSPRRIGIIGKNSPKLISSSPRKSRSRGILLTKR